MKNKFFTIIISGLLLATNVSAFSKNIIKIEFQSLLKPPASPKTFSAQHAFKLNRSIESNSSYFAFAIYLQNELQAFFDGSDFYKISNIDSTILKFENKNSAPEIIDSVVSANLHITQPVWLLTKGNSIEILKEDFRLTSDLANEKFTNEKVRM
ncbi:MAG: hypothetical protein IPO27_15700 [Bacteroidetes bacterium]|nr:hypothetical protein [Bacteroidota bacterium]